MTVTTVCDECGSVLKEQTAQGLCPRCLMEMSLAACTMVDGESAPQAPTLSVELMAERFPQFEILECLGRGGMGVVYKARQKALERLVAIKVLVGEHSDDLAFEARFLREAKILARLNHPNIVTVHDFGESGGMYYLVMEFVDGVNLRDVLSDGKMQPEEALAIVPHICEALEYAHQEGVIHRDIKPENLLMDRNGRVKIADFGVASLVGTTSELSGTPPYMAPEQEAGIIDQRADIYALGVVLYEMLTGERPGKEWVSPSNKVGVDVKIDEIVLRALEKAPERRYQTAGEFKTILNTVGQPTPTINPAANRPPAPRRRIAMVGWVVVALLLGGVVLWSVAGWFLQPPTVSAAVVEPAVDASPPTESAETTLRFLSRETKPDLIRYEWEIKPHRPIGVVVGWYAVQDGKVVEYQALGGNLGLLDYAFKLSLEHQNRDHLLQLNIGHCSGLSVMSSREVPGKLFNSLAKSQPEAMSADAYTEIWRGECVTQSADGSGDKILKTYIYVARLLASGEDPGGSHFNRDIQSGKLGGNPPRVTFLSLADGYTLAKRGSKRADGRQDYILLTATVRALEKGGHSVVLWPKVVTADPGVIKGTVLEMGDPEQQVVGGTIGVFSPAELEELMRSLAIKPGLDIDTGSSGIAKPGEWQEIMIREGQKDFDVLRVHTTLVNAQVMDLKAEFIGGRQGH